MHCRIHKATVTVEALYISRAVIPVDSEGVDRRVRVVRIGVQEFHEPTKIVRLSGRFANEVHMVYVDIRSALGVLKTVKPREERRLLRGTGLRTCAKCARQKTRVKRDAG